MFSYIFIRKENCVTGFKKKKKLLALYKFFKILDKRETEYQRLNTQCFLQF